MKKKILQFITWFRYHLYLDDFCLFLFFCLVLFLLMLATSCKSPKATTETVVRYIDSTVISYRDSLIEVPVPVERYIDVVNYLDTLKLETSLAKATAFADTTTKTLKGTLENKPVNLTKTVYLPSKERIVYRDSIQTKEVPVEVVKWKTRTPKWAWWSLVGFTSALAWIFRKQVLRLVKYLIALF